jgi:hypothetical protein
MAMLGEIVEAGMATSRKGKRAVTIRGTRYFWKAALGPRGRAEYGVTVTIETEEAFVPGQRAAGLVLFISFLESDRIETTNIDEQTMVTPRSIRCAVEYALARQPPFRFQIGEPDLVLTAEESALAMADDERG